MNKPTTPTTQKLDRHPSRKRNRSRREQRGLRPAASKLTYHKRKIPSFNLLDEKSLNKIEDHADWLLVNVGVEFRGDIAAIELFKQAGAKVSGTRIRFEQGHVRHLCKTAPFEFELYSREPDHIIEVGGDNIVLMPGYGSPFVTDLNKGRRYASMEDFQNFVKLTYSTPYLHHSGGTVVEPVDIPVNKRHLDMVFSHLTLSDKPFMGAVTSMQGVEDSLAMAEIAYGKDFLKHHTVMQGNINVNSPFVFDETMSSALRRYAEANQCVCVSPSIFGGAMGPVTPAAIAAQTLAECMVGIALAQLVNPGCPVVMGSFHSTMNLRTGSLTFGTPEANLVSMALSQLGRRLGVPVRSGGGEITATNAPDGQAMADSTNAMWATMFSGTHQVWHAAGWLEGGLTMSYEKFILDLDNCGALLRLMQGMEVNEDTLSRESYLEVNPGENFLSTKHTLTHFADANYESLLADTGPYETWVENGSPTADQRANLVWREMLANYKPPSMDKTIKAELQKYVDTRKAEMSDQWY